MLNEDVAVHTKTQNAKYKFPEFCWHPLATVLLQKGDRFRVLTSVYILKHDCSQILRLVPGLWIFLTPGYEGKI